MAAEAKLVLLYAMSANGMMLRRLMYTIEQQKQMDRIFPPSSAFVSILFVDSDPDSLPENIIQFFGRANIHMAHSTVISERGERFCYSRLRNKSLDYITAMADANDWNWLMLCDGDTVIRRDGWTLPGKPWARPKVYWQKNLNETLGQSLRAIGDGKDLSVFSDGNSWFMLSKDLFTTVRFNEQIFGYGWEDNEFAQRINALWGGIEETDMLVVHSFHADSERNALHDRRDHNLSIFRATEAMLREGWKSPLPLDIRVVPANHPHWRGNLALIPERSRILHVIDNTVGSYEFDTGLLRVVWDKWGPESFLEQNGAFTYSGPPKE